MSATAWMLRNDGVSFPVKIHLYTMQDDDFSSEAEASSFILICGKADQDQAEYCLDAWMAKLVEDEVTSGMTADQIDEILKDQLNHLPYKFPYPLSTDQYLAIHLKLDNWSDFSSLADFCDTITEAPEPIWQSIEQSLNQQFCRSRFGGQYNTHTGNRDMWFRISSLGFNWSDVIYTWVADHYTSMNIETITVCRDAESDYGFDHTGKPEHFYKARDGKSYYLMPIDEFLAAEHESNPVFAQMELGRGPRRVMTSLLAAGYSIYAAEQQSGLEFSGLQRYYLRNERLQCVQSSAFMDETHPKTQGRMRQLEKRLETDYPISIQDIDQTPYEYANGRVVDSLDVVYTRNDDHKLETTKLVMNKGLSRTTVDEMMRQFRMLFKR
jgi:hypothetical protein